MLFFRRSGIVGMWEITCEKCGAVFPYKLSTGQWRSWRLNTEPDFFITLDRHIDTHEKEEERRYVHDPLGRGEEAVGGDV